METDYKSLVTKIHGTPTKAVIIATGGGSEIFPILTARGGASSTLLAGYIPYTQEEFYNTIGFRPEKIVNEETTRALAMAAYQKANKLSAGPVIGIASNVSLQKTPSERSGRVHNLYTVLHTASQTVVASMSIAPQHKILGSSVDIREWEENLTAKMMLNLLAEGCGIDERVELSNTVKDLLVRKKSLITSPELTGLFEGTEDRLLWSVEGIGDYGTPITDYPNRYIFPGSFNPAHEGHFEMAEETGADFELSITNVDKPVLDYLSIESRLGSFTQRSKVWLTNAPTFVEKAKLFPNTTFVVGYDTAERICNPKYAGPLDEVFNIFEYYNTTFIVFPRVKDDVLHSDLSGFPERFRNIAVTSETNRKFAHLSSSDIRKGIRK